MTTLEQVTAVEESLRFQQSEPCGPANMWNFDQRETESDREIQFFPRKGPEMLDFVNVTSPSSRFADGISKYSFGFEGVSTAAAAVLWTNGVRPSPEKLAAEDERRHSHIFVQILEDIDQLGSIAEEEEVPFPDSRAISNARVMIKRLYRFYPVRYQVTPTERRGVSIDAPMRKAGAVSVECAPNDIVYCFAAIDGIRRRAKFYQMEGLPDKFILQALDDLAKG